MINVFFKKEQTIKKRIDFNILNDILIFKLKSLYQVKIMQNYYLKILLI